ncbi:MAG: TonB-dependent receptor [Thermodesulfovibrionales bacterium]
MDKAPFNLLVPCLAGILLLFSCCTVRAQTEEEEVLALFFGQNELVVTPTRDLKPASQTAENISVVTAEQIGMMNAHTLADALYFTPGVQVHRQGGPGSISTVHIQSSENRHVTVLLDGVTMSSVGENIAELGILPVQNIERIEIIKGPASSAWGSSLGGVINIITKSGRSGREPGGTLSASYGQGSTGDFRGEAYGGKGRFGYYLSAGRLQTAGFREKDDFSGENLYAKLSYASTENSALTFSFGYSAASRGVFEWRENNLSQDEMAKVRFFSLSFAASPGKGIDLEFSLRLSQLSSVQVIEQTGSETTQERISYWDNGYGGSAQATWEQGAHAVVAGVDFDDRRFKARGIPSDKKDTRRWALFANDTFTPTERLSLIPGLRFDSTGTNGGFLSPSLGITYSLTKTTLLRATVARGFSTPALDAAYASTRFYQPNTDLEVEKVTSYQAGVESSAPGFLWLKLSAFRHEIRDALASQPVTPTSFTLVNKEKQRHQGIELEVRTAPFHHITLSAGAVFMQAKDLQTGVPIRQLPQYTYDASLRYDDGRSFTALAQGHYIWWRGVTSVIPGQYNGFLFDVTLNKVLLRKGDARMETFLTAHNLFNASQYLYSVYRNPGRWVEGGIRYRF